MAAILMITLIKCRSFFNEGNDRNYDSYYWNANANNGKILNNDAF